MRIFFLRFVVFILAIVSCAQVSLAADPEVYARWSTSVAAGSSAFADTAIGACALQKAAFAPENPGLEALPVPGYPHVRLCDWCTHTESAECPLNPLPTTIGLKCVDASNNILPSWQYKVLPPSTCRAVSRYQPPQDVCSAENGARLNMIAGNPVVISTGTKIELAQDFSTQDGLFNITRTYRSDPGEFKQTYISNKGTGLNWRLNFAWDLKLGSSFSSYNRPFSIMKPSGALYDYSFDASGNISKKNHTPSGLKVTLLSPATFNEDDILNNGATFKIVNEDDEEIIIELYRYGTDKYYRGRVKEITYPTGYQLTFAYVAADELATVTDSNNRQFSFTWLKFPRPGESFDRARAIKSIQLPDGNSLHYSYDAANSIVPAQEAYERLTKVETKSNSGVVLDSTTYHYENSNLPYALTGITDHKGVRYATFAYDYQGRVTLSEHDGGADRTTFAYEENGSERITKVTNALGKTANYVFKKYNSSMRLESVDGEASANCLASQKNFTYFGYGLQLKTTTDEEGRVTVYQRDSEGRPTKITRASGTPNAHVTDITWSPTHNKPTQIKSPNKQADFTYNSAGALTQMTETDITSHSVPYSTNGQVRTWAITYTPQGRVATIDGPLAGTGDTVTYSYGTNFELSAVTNELGHQTQILAVNGRGQPMQIQGPNGKITDLAYDAMGRLTSMTDDPSGIAALTQITYDAIGLVTKITRPDGSYLSYTYNNARRLTSVENNKGERIEYSHDLMGNITQRQIKDGATTIIYTQQRTYDELGRMLQLIGVQSRIWTNAYNRLGELTSQTDPRGKSWTNAYDALGRLISQTDPDNKQVTRNYDADNNLATYTDPRNIQTTFVHNGFGEVIQESSPDIGTVIYERDARGLITKKTDARSIETVYAYDDGGRLISVAYTGAAVENVTLGYDSTASGNKGIGRLTSRTDQGGTTSYVYDILGRVLSQTRLIGGQTHSVGYQYDASGNITQITYPSGRNVSYSYDSEGLVSSVATMASPTAQSVTLASNVTWQAFGPINRIDYGNDVSLTKSFTSNYDIDAITVKRISTGAILSKYSHSYQDGRNLTLITDDVTTGQNQSFVYDNPNRLQNAVGLWGSYTYSYDATGNRITLEKVQSLITNTEDITIASASNRVQSIALNSTPVRSFTYDASGNILTDVKNGVTTSYSYNHAGRLSYISVGGVSQGAYIYNAMGQLVRRTVLNIVPSGTTHYLHDLNGNVIAELDDAGVTLREYIWIPHRNTAQAKASTGAATPLAVVSDVGTPTSKLYSVHSDHLDRPIMMTDELSNIVWQASYMPFGGVNVITGTASLDARFPGQWYQLENGLHYNWHRHYDPSLGRYTQPDPLGLVDGPSRYAYALNAPQVYTDPNGQKIAWAIAVGVAAYKVYKIARKQLKNFHFEGPGKDFVIHGHGRICQIRYKDNFIRLDYDPVSRKKGNQDPILHLNIGSSKPGRKNWHVPVNPKRWF